MMVQKWWPSDKANNILRCELLYVCDKKNLINNFLASVDIKVFGHTYLHIYNAASDWPRTFLYPGYFV